MDSSFFSPSSTTKEGDLAILHVTRDLQIPVKLSRNAASTQDLGYAEGNVTNTKFGSFPHSTLIGVQWGSQILASKVDTGTRGRLDPSSSNKKRRAAEISADEPGSDLKAATVASSGFVHVLPPTPEGWTTSLPHRTQVVYTPDYSYILHRIRARPGSSLIEAGSGSGSFTHAAARAVYNGPNLGQFEVSSQDRGNIGATGHVYTFEYHKERQLKIEEEMADHKLDDIVTATHRDVYKHGFWLQHKDGKTKSPRCSSIFLDLPAPWEALRHLTREDTEERPSALDPDLPAYICTFSPCIEQVQKTVSALRKFGWLEIDMVEIQHKRVDVRREHVGYEFEGYRGVNVSASNVDQALAKLEEVERKQAKFHERSRKQDRKDKVEKEPLRPEPASKNLWNKGSVIHRTESEIRTHTSYLTFAVLPQKWSVDNEAALVKSVA